MQLPTPANRRSFLQAGAGAGLALYSWGHVAAQPTSLADRILILIELKGGNDGLNTLVPFADPVYAALRPTIALKESELIKLDAQTALHPELKGLEALWAAKQLAIVQGVGYPQPVLSHFRSIEVWETSSHAQEVLHDGWITRAMQAGLGARAAYTTQGVVVGSGQYGALAGAKAITLNNPDAFINQARLASPSAAQGNAALQHLLAIEGHVGLAASGLRGERYAFQTEFPTGAFGNATKAAAQIVASQRGKAGVPVIVLTLGSFDTHQNQLVQHANLLRQLAGGIQALQSALTELGAWERSLLMTYSEFGRRPKQNNSGGTDHGTAAPHFVAGGAVRGGLYGQAPDLSRLDSSGNLAHSIDFRQLYSTVAQQWWGIDPLPVVRGRFDPLAFLRT